MRCDKRYRSIFYVYYTVVYSCIFVLCVQTRNNTKGLVSLQYSYGVHRHVYLYLNTLLHTPPVSAFNWQTAGNVSSNRLLTSTLLTDDDVMN